MSADKWVLIFTPWHRPDLRAVVLQTTHPDMPTARRHARELVTELVTARLKLKKTSYEHTPEYSHAQWLGDAGEPCSTTLWWVTHDDGLLHQEGFIMISPPPHRGKQHV